MPRTAGTLHAAAFGALLFTTAVTAPAVAQTARPHRAPDANGVDLTHGDFLMSMVEGSIGSGMAELSLVRNGVWVASGINVNGHQWDRIGFQQTPVSGGLQYAVTIGQRYEIFTATGTLPSGSSLTGSANNYVYRSADGTAIEFTDAGNGGWGTDSNFCTGAIGQGACVLIPTAINEPNGKTVSLGWEMWTDCWGEIDSETLPCHFTPRLSDVSNSFGYSIQFAYASGSGGGSGGPPSSWHQRTGATFHNAQVSGNPSQGSVSYSYPSTGVTQVTDMGGLVWRFAGTIVGVTGIRRPGASSDTTTISYSGSVVTSVVNEGVTTAYSRSVSGSTATMTVTAVDGDSGTTDPVTTAVSNLTTGRLTSITDPLSRQTQYQYDGNGRLTRVTAPEGNYVQYTYDGRGNVTEVRRVAKSGSGLADIVVSASFDSTCSNPLTCNQPNSVTDACGHTTDYTYDATHGGVLTVTAPAPAGSGDRPQTRYTYTLTNGEYLTTAISRCASGTSPGCVGTANETVVTIVRDANGNVTSTTTADGTGTLTATTALAYDALGNLLTVDGPLSGSADTVRYRYNAARQPVGAVGPDPDGGGSRVHGARRTTYTNGLPTKAEIGTVNSQSDGDWASFSAAERVEQDYDANARPVQRRRMSGSTTYAVAQTGYDAFGRVQCQVQRMNPSEFASLTSDACALDTQGSGSGDYGPDRIRRTYYDAAGQVSQVRTAFAVSGQEANEASFTYSNNGRAQTVTDANGNATAYQYDGHDRHTATFYPNASGGGTSSSDYEAFGYTANLVTSRTNRDGTVQTYGYDDLDRLTTRDLPGSEPTVSYTYDLMGRMLTASTSAQTLTNTWDALGRNLTQVGPQGTATSAYDAAGRRTSLTYPGSGLAIGYTYDVAANLTEIRENPSGSNTLLATYAYDSLGRRTSLTRGNGATTSYSYDNVSRLSQMVHDLDGGATTNDLTLGYSYNPASQIAQTTRSNDVYAWGGHYAVNRSYAANGLNQYSAVGGNTPTHDSKGNLTFAGPSGTPTYTYNSENLLTSTSTSVSLSYDPATRLYETVGGSTTRRAYDGDNLIADYNGSNTLQARYVFGPGGEPLVRYDVPNSSARYYYHEDERGSVIAQSNNSGAMASINAYDEYGIPASGNTGRFQYTGQQWLPELGMQYSRARIYSPTWGRFAQTDPIGFAGGMNLYGYVLNDPVNMTDPSGTCEVMAGNLWDIFNGATGQHVGTEMGPTFYTIGGGGNCSWAVALGDYFLHAAPISSDGSGTGVGSLGPCDRPPQVVNIRGTLVVSGALAGISTITGTLTDVTTGRAVDFVGRGPVFDEGGGMVGIGLGTYHISGTLNGGFNVLDDAFQIRYWSVGLGPISLGSASIRSRSGDLGNISVTGTIAIPAGIGGINFYGVRTTPKDNGTCG